MILMFTLSAQAFAQELDQHLSSKIDIWKTSESLDQFLTRNGFDLKKKDWSLITIGLNKLESESLVKRSEDLKIMLPTKTVISEIKKPARSIASLKMSCQILSRKYIDKKLNTDAKFYSDYVDMIAERKVEVKKGQKIINILKKDHFEYKSLKQAYMHTLRDNKIKKNTIEKSGTLILPFCASKEIRRSIAALNTNITELNSKKKTLFPIPLNVGLALGQFTVDQESRKLSMNFLKLQVSGKYKLNSDYMLTGKVSGASFTNIKYSEAIGETSTSNFYPEFGASISTRSGAFSYGASLDRINYFLIKDESNTITLEPNQLNKLSANGFYSINDGLGVFANAGYMNGFDSENINGLDLSIGGSYAFGEQKRFKVSPLMYYGSVNSNLSSKADLKRFRNIIISRFLN